MHRTGFRRRPLRGQHSCSDRGRNHFSPRTALVRQAGVGKGDAVRLGFARAHGDMLMILDADLTVPPEDLPRFYEALYSGNWGIHQRRSVGYGKQAFPKFIGQQIFLLLLFRGSWANRSKIPVRHEGFMETGLRDNRRQSYLFW
jgi:glycosyltransferase involved in cell wall biosynthesis